MKRRTKGNVGQWPNLRADTLKAISEELIRARKKHPHRAGNLAMLRTAESVLHSEMDLNDQNKISSSQIYARAAQVAAMAIRVLEEGTGEHRYAGNTQAPEFTLSP